jgi:hypothetical protein
MNADFLRSGELKKYGYFLNSLSNLGYLTEGGGTTGYSD